MYFSDSGIRIFGGQKVVWMESSKKRDDRIGTALTSTGVWHNLMNLYPG